MTLAMVLIAFLCSVLFLISINIAETAAVAANRRQFREDEAAGDRSAAGVMAMLGRLRSILSGTMALRILGIVIGALSLRGVLILAPGDAFEGSVFGGFMYADLLTLLIAPPALVLISEIAGRQYARREADRLARIASYPLRMVAWALSPVIEAGQIALRSLLFPAEVEGPESEYSREDLAQWFGARPAEEEDEPYAEESTSASAAELMVHNIVDLQKTRVVEIMKPLSDVVAVRMDEAGIDSLIELARRTGYSNFPVFRDRIIHLEGYVNIQDVLRNDDPRKTRIEHFVRTAFYAPEMIRVNELLRQFLTQRLTVAIIVDEYGACSGWVTREDLLEEIVGEIEDEFDPQRRNLLTRNDDGDYICEGQIDIDDLNEVLGARFPKDGFETLGGWIFWMLSRVPVTGDSVLFEDYEVEVLAMDGPAIERARIHRIPDTES